MSNPFAVPTTLAPHDRITSRQREFLRSLVIDKAKLEGIENPDTAQIDTWLDTKSKGEASALIDTVKEEIRELRLGAARAFPIAEIEDGFYELPDGRIAKVIHAIHGSGSQYAKLFNTETRRFDMSSGLITVVRREGVRIDVNWERATELGKLYGVCMVCGTTLTDDSEGGSIELGIGPVCAGKF
jgi:hypothetical protein